MAQKKRKSISESEPAAEKKRSRFSPPAILAIPPVPKLFPRGGTKDLTPFERKEIRAQADHDVLFEENTGRKSARPEYESRAPRSEDGASDDAGQHGGKKDSKIKRGSKKKATTTSRKEVTADKHDSTKNEVRVEGLSYKRMLPGTLVLGQVSQINEDDVALTLPNNLTGFIPASEISDLFNERNLQSAPALVDATGEESNSSAYVDLAQIFTIGQYLRAYVLASTNDGTSQSRVKRHISLSLRPQLVNSGLNASNIVKHSLVQASIRSKEERGFVMDLGLPSSAVSGFLPHTQLGSELAASQLVEGAVFLCLVTDFGAGGRTAMLSVDPSRIGDIQANACITEAPDIEAFLPGSAVEFLVCGITSTELVGKLMGLLDVTADTFHSGALGTRTPFESHHRLGQKLKARVICTFPASESKKLGVSLLPQILQWRPVMCRSANDQLVHPTSQCPLSTIINSAKVIKVVPGLGLFMDLGIPEVQGFVHVGQLSDKKNDILYETSGPYQTGSLQKARLINYNAIDGLFNLTLKSSLLERPFLRIEDLTVGQCLTVVSKRLIVTDTGLRGLVVDICEGIEGFVPELQLSDVVLQQPERKFRPGTKFSARVLSVSTAKRQLRLTLKKTLINNSNEPWTELESLKVGMEGPGVLAKILPKGAVVEFFGDLRAFLPISEMSHTFVSDPETYFHKGQTLTVRIASIEPESGRMIVSCRNSSMLTPDQRDELASLDIGSIVSARIVEKTDKDISLKVGNTGLSTSMTLEHLVDGSKKKAVSAHKQLSVGQTIREILILDKNMVKETLNVTRKPALIKASKENLLIKELDDVKLGDQVAGFVTGTTPSGIFVRFAGSMTALVPKHEIPAEMRDLPDYGLSDGNSISGRVSTIDETKARFCLSLLPIAAQPVTTPPSTKVHTATSQVECGKIEASNYGFGTSTTATVISVKDTQLNVALAEGILGRVDVSSVYDSFDNISDRKCPLRKFSPKQSIQVRIIGMHDSRHHKFLPVSHRSKAPVFELTAKPSQISEPALSIFTIDKVETGSFYTAFVNNVLDDAVWVNISPAVRGRIMAKDISEDLSMLEDLAKNFPIGSAIRVKVVSVDVEKDRLNLTVKTGDSGDSRTLEDLAQGQILCGRVTKTSERGLMVQLSSTISGSVDLVDLSDDYSRTAPWNYKKNQIIRVCVRGLDLRNKKLSLSTRPSLVLSSSLAVRDPDHRSHQDLKVNDIRRGFVKSVADNGLFVALSHDVTALVLVTNLSDEYVKDWKPSFEITQLVEGKIISIDGDSGRVQMSLKASHMNKEYKPPIVYDDLQVGQIISGTVRKVESFGVFVVIDDSANVSGLCHKTQMSDRRNIDPHKLYKSGDRVKGVILAKNAEKRQLSIGLKTSALEAAGPTVPSSDEDNMKLLETGPDIESDESASEDTDEDVSPPIESGDDLPASAQVQGKTKYSLPLDEQPLDNLSSTPWQDVMQKFDVKTSTFEPTIEPSEQTADYKARKKPDAMKSTEDQTANLDANGPQTAADFERWLLGQPNSSTLWLGYMAWYLQDGDVAKARDVAERALLTIHISQETEKLNVWIGMLNLEVAFGEDDTVQQVFERACQHNNAEKVHERLISIYVQSGQNAKAEELFQQTLKKFTQTPALYLNYATFLMSSMNKAEQARSLLPRAMQILPAREHLGLTSKFAQLEFNSPNGDAERGRTIFETILAKWPKRLDMWVVFIDIEIKHGEAENVRRLFERVLGPGTGTGTTSKSRPQENKIRLSSRKTKYFFNRWIKFETDQNEDKRRQRVEMLMKERLDSLDGE